MNSSEYSHFWISNDDLLGLKSSDGSYSRDSSRYECDDETDNVQRLTPSGHIRRETESEALITLTQVRQVTQLEPQIDIAI